MSAAGVRTSKDEAVPAAASAETWRIEDLEALVAPGPVKDFIRGFLKGLFGVPA